MSERIYEGWIVVLRTGTDYEADIVRDRLDDSGIPAVVLTQRDHAFNLTVGDLAPVSVLVPPDRAEEARALLDSEPPSDHEIAPASREADPGAASAHDDAREAMLDSGAEEINFSAPDDEDSTS